MTAFTQFKITHPDGTQFYCRKWMPEAPAKGIILLIHGLSDHGDRFSSVGEYFARRGYIFFAPDLRGNGKSGGRRGHFLSMEQVMGDIRFLISAAKTGHDPLPVVLYGQSMGGNLSVNYALRYPQEVKGVISSSPWLRLSHPPAKMVVKLASLLRRLMPALQIHDGIKSKDLSHDTTVQSAYDSDPFIHWKISVHAFFIISEAGEWALMNAATLRVPLLLMHGNADNITDFNASREFADAAGKSCRFKEWPGLFHELHNEAERGQVLGYIEAWLDEINRSR